MQLRQQLRDRVNEPSLVFNAVSNWASYILNVAVGFFLTPFIISYIGKDGYGIWTLVGSLLGYFGLLDVGIKSAIYRYVARFSAQGDHHSMNSYINTALSFFSAIGFVVALFSLLFAGSLADFFEVASSSRHSFIGVVIIIGVATGISFPGNVFGIIIQAHEKFIISNFSMIFFTLLRAALTILFLVKGLGIVGVAWATLIVTLLRVPFNIMLCKYFCPGIRFSFLLSKWDSAKALMFFGLPSAIIGLADTLRFQLDSVVIGKWLDVSQVGVYRISSLLMGYALSLIVTGLGVVTPRFSALDGKNNTEELQDLLLRSLSISAVLGCGICLLVGVFGNLFISLWVGEGFKDAVPVLWILAFAYSLDLAQHSTVGFMYATNKHRFYAIISVLEGIANFVVSVILVRPFGIVGVALGTLIPIFFIKAFVQPYYMIRITTVRPMEYVSRVARPFLLCVVIVSVSYFLGIPQKSEGTYLGLLSMILPFGAFYILASALVLCPKDRDFMLSFVFRKGRRKPIGCKKAAIR